MHCQALAALLLLSGLLLPIACQSPETLRRQAPPIDGLSFVATPRPFSPQALPAVQGVGAGWLAVIPYGFARPDAPVLHYGAAWQWWGERPEGVRATIGAAHAAGLRVMLKPQVYVPGGWIGSLDYGTPEAWAAWEQSYRDFLLPFARMADSMGVALLCIGTELERHAQARPEFWRQLIADVRGIYGGQLTYAANWDGYERLAFWPELDYIGVNAYFPLSGAARPSVAQLKRQWRPIVARLADFSARQGRPILFTECGYLSVEGCAGKTWELEANIGQCRRSEAAQAHALEALLASFWPEEFWAGAFLWKWFPDGQGHEGYFDKDYTPQGKAAEAVLARWYAKGTE